MGCSNREGKNRRDGSTSLFNDSNSKTLKWQKLLINDFHGFRNSKLTGKSMLNFSCHFQTSEYRKNRWWSLKFTWNRFFIESLFKIQNSLEQESEVKSQLTQIRVLIEKIISLNSKLTLKIESESKTHADHV